MSTFHSMSEHSATSSFHGAETFNAVVTPVAARTTKDVLFAYTAISGFALNCPSRTQPRMSCDVPNTHFLVAWWYSTAKHKLSLDSSHSFWHACSDWTSDSTGASTSVRRVSSRPEAVQAPAGACLHCFPAKT